MKQYWQKWMESLDDEDIYRHISRDFDDDYRRGEGGRDGSGGGRESYHQMGKEGRLRKLASIYEKIEDYFESQGLDPRSYMEQNRRGNNR